MGALTPQARLVVIFASLGHFLHHVLTGLFLTLAIVLERVWEKPYAEIIALWTLGAAMIGLGAPLAGWLADRFSQARMMAVFFLGLGASAIGAGLVADASGMAMALAALGIFGAIYHPVGMAWVSMTAPADRRGRIMGVLGIAGSIGVALAAVIAGGLTELGGWRLAMILPGAVTVLAGLLLMSTIFLGKIDIGAAPGGAKVGDKAGGASEMRAPFAVLAVLTVTFTLGAIAYAAYTTALPKWLSDSLALDASEAGSLGLVVGAIMLSGSIGQVIGGRLADRLPFKWLYVGTFVLKLLPFAVAAVFDGPAMLLVAMLIGLTFDMTAPVENLLLARYSSGRRRGLAFGLKFAIGFAAAPLGINLVSYAYGEGAGGAAFLFGILTLLAATMVLAALLLPAERDKPSGRAAGAVAG
jgi:MFS family permease